MGRFTAITKKFTKSVQPPNNHTRVKTPFHAQLLNEFSDSHSCIKLFASSTEVLAPTEGNTHWRTEDHETFSTSETCKTWNVAFALALCFSFEPVSIASTTPIHELFATLLFGIIVPAKNCTSARTHVLRKSTIIHYCWNKVCGEEENKLACCWLFSPSHNLVTNVVNLMSNTVNVSWCIHNILGKVCLSVIPCLFVCLSFCLSIHEQQHSKLTRQEHSKCIVFIMLCVSFQLLLNYNCCIRNHQK